MLRIGVDVGGTNTDAVLMDGRRIVHAVKRPTTRDVTGGLMSALREVLAGTQVTAADVALVVIGTTHFTNAVVQRRGLSPTAVVRLCLPAAQSLPPMIDWPEPLAREVGEHIFLAHGGMEFDGTPISHFDEREIRAIGTEIRARGLRAIAVTGIFAPVRAEFEREAARILAESCPEASITVSADIGQLGLLERESATILNSALLALARETVAALRAGVRECGLACPMFLSQNDGTLLDAAQAERFPVLTFASGPTNSMRGAAFLSGLSEAIVLDVGGTTTDVGLLHGGFPRNASTTVDVGGVRTNFRMPDVFSIGLGGGSIVVADGTRLEIGPRSVGCDLPKLARVFGGEVLTATDIAVAAGRARIGDPTRVARLGAELVGRSWARIETQLTAAVDRARLSPEPIPVLAVGGGSILVPERLAGLEVVRPEHFAIANAVGAAIAQVAGEVDRVYSLDTLSREQALDEAEREARRKAVAMGAIEQSITVTEREDVPLAYLRGDATRVRVKVVGEMRI